MLVLLAGCGASAGGEENVPAPLKDDLLARVSAVIEVEKTDYKVPDEVVYADFVRAREQLGLPAEADVYERRPSETSETFQLASVADSALLFSGQSPVTPLQEAIDGATIKRAARVGVLGAPSALVIETTQPFEEISASLRKHGYVRDGELSVSARSSATTVYPVVADAGDGIVVAAGSKQAARAALEGRDARLTQAAQLLADVPGVARAASTKRNRCIVARAAGQDLGPQRGEYLVVIDGAAEAAKLGVAGRTLVQGDLTFGNPVADGQRVTVGFKSEDSLNTVFTEIVNDDYLVGSLNGSELPYAC